MSIDKTTWVCQLPEEKQRLVFDMVAATACADCVADAMCSRLCDLEDTIDIKQLLES